MLNEIIINDQHMLKANPTHIFALLDIDKPTILAIAEKTVEKQRIINTE